MKSEQPSVGRAVSAGVWVGKVYAGTGCRSRKWKQGSPTFGMLWPVNIACQGGPERTPPVRQSLHGPVGAANMGMLSGWGLA